MAANKFIGWTKLELLTWRRAIQEARLTGRATRVTTAPGVYTEFDPQHDVNLDKVLDEIQYALSLLDANEANPANSRPGITIQAFN